MADLFPCPNKSDCADAAADSIVVRNFSSEPPDRNLFFALFFPPQGQPGFSNTNPQLCGATSQQTALTCAARPPNNGIGDGLPVVFTNAEQSCSVACPAAPPKTYTVAAGTFLAMTQADADALAAAFACQAAVLSCSGDDLPELFDNEPQTCSQTCAGETVSYTVPSGVFQALDQASANLIAFLFACAAISQACQEGEVPPPQPTAPNKRQTCSVPCGSGTFTAVVPYNTYRAESQAAANAVAATAACNLAATLRTCLAPISDSICVDEPYSRPLVLTGPLAGQVTGFNISGNFPPGIAASQAELSGTPITPGNYAFTITFVFSDGNASVQSGVISVGGLSGTLPDGDVGAAYVGSISTVGMSSPTFSLVGGALPTGLSLSAGGQITGTPSADGESFFTVQASDGVLTCSKEFSITINGDTCPDWGTLFWGTASSSGDNPPATSWLFAPQNDFSNSLPMHTFLGSGGVAAFPPDLAVLIFGNSGDIVYNGSGCNCNAHLQVSFGFTDPTEVVFTIEVEDITGANILLVQTLQGNQGGIYELPFTLPNTAGFNHTIRVTISSTLTNTISGGSANVTFNGTITNI